MARKRKYDIFVVGSCNDKSNIDPIVVKLRTDGYRCWTGVRRSGNNTKLPYRAIEASSVILFFSSVRCDNIKHIRLQIELAVQLNKPIIHVRFDDNSCCDDLLAHVEGIAVVSWHDNDDGSRTYDNIISVLTAFNVPKSLNGNLTSVASALATTGSMVSSGRAVSAVAVAGSVIGGVAVATPCAIAASTIVGRAAVPIVAAAGCFYSMKKIWNWINDSDVEDNVDRKGADSGDDTKALVIDQGKLSKRGDGKVLGSVFAPSEISANSNLMIQVYLHTAKEIEEICRLARDAQKASSRRGQVPLSCPLHVGDKVDILLNIYGKKLISSQKKRVVWQGSFINCAFRHFISPDIMSNNVCCEVLLSMKEAPIGEMLFTVEIVDAPRSLPAEVLTRQFHKVFISYAHQDESRVRFMARGFKALCVDYFFDRDYLKAGDVFPVKIRDYIKSADLFILCWSKNAAKSEYVGLELAQALELAFPKVKPPEDARIAICPYSIEPKAELPASMRNDYHFEDV